MNIIVDIETAPNERAETYLNEVIKIKPAKNLVNETAIKKNIAIKRSEAASKVSLNPRAAKVIAIGYQAYRGFKPASDVKCLHGTDEVTLLEEFASYLTHSEHLGDVHLYAYNGDGFDYPFLRNRYMFNDLGVPDVLFNRYRCHDLMKMFEMQWGDKVSLNEIAWACGIDGKTDDAKKIKDWYEEENWEKIVELNVGDVVAESKLFLRSRPFGGFTSEDKQ